MTGSKYLLEAAGRKVLVDCGLFQGYKQLRLRNWAPPPFDSGKLDAVVLTRAHIDHSGYLPLLVKQGFRGKIYASAATRDLCRILLADAAHLQEEEAYFANKQGFSKHQPATPLFDSADAARALKLIKAVSFHRQVSLGDEVDFELVPNGHMLGSGCVMVRAEGQTVVFSGDLGRPDDPIMRAPERIETADWLVLESTYGDRLHSEENPQDRLAEVINRTAARGGVVIIPSFAVARAQTIMHHLARLKAKRRIPADFSQQPDGGRYHRAL